MIVGHYNWGLNCSKILTHRVNYQIAQPWNTIIFMSNTTKAFYINISFHLLYMCFGQNMMTIDYIELLEKWKYMNMNTYIQMVDIME